jgi:hypothetical protein
VRELLTQSRELLKQMEVDCLGDVTVYGRSPRFLSQVGRRPGLPFPGKEKSGATDDPSLPTGGIYPRYCSDLRLLQNQVRSRSASRGACGGSGRNASSVGIEVQYAVFFRAEPANASLVEDQGR